MSSRACLGLLLVLAGSGCAASRSSEPPSAPQGAVDAKVSTAESMPGPMRLGVVAPQSPPDDALGSDVDIEAARAMLATSPAINTSLTSIEAARAMLAEGERQVGQLLAQSEQHSTRGEAKAPASAPASAPDSDEESSRPKKSAADRSNAAGRVRAPETKFAESAPAPVRAVQADGRCAIACKALTSMRRAADRMCDLVGVSDDQCSDARARVVRSQSRVSSVCPACEGAR